MEPDPSSLTVLSWHKGNEVSKNDLPPSSPSGVSVAPSSIIEDSGYAERLVHSTTATHQSPNDRKVRPAVEDDLRHIGGSGIQLQHVGGRLTEIVQAQSEPELDSSGNLEFRLRGAMIKSVGTKIEERFFIPFNDIERIIDVPSVRLELKELGLEDQNLDSTAHQICSIHERQSTQGGKKTKTTRQRILGTLVLMNETQKILEVIAENLYDWDLPLVLDRSDRGHLRLAKRDADDFIRPVRFAQDWTSFQNESFERSQWQLSSPCFEMRTQVGTKINHYPLAPSSILPIVKVDEEEHRGGFASVLKVKIHPDHRKSTSTNQDPDSWLALKRLKCNDKEAFKAEVEPLKRLGNDKNPHIIQLMATFHYQEEHYLVFEWADGGNLFDFWQFYPKPDEPPRNHELCKWLSTQLTGLASALALIHNYHFDPRAANMSAFDSRDGRRIYGTHGDLKPENILWFKSTPKDEEACVHGTFKLSDFGLTSFHGSESGQMFQPPGFSATYRAPEYDLNRLISQKYDIWSLGCVLTELITWYLLGAGGVTAFSEKRSKESSDPKFRQDNFFSITEPPSTSSGGRATAKKCVQEHFDFLRSQSNCSDFIADIIDFVQDHLLRMSPEKRCEVSQFLKFARDMAEKCVKESAYCVHRLKPVDSRANTDLSTLKARISLQSNSSKENRNNPGRNSARSVNTKLEVFPRRSISTVGEIGTPSTSQPDPNINGDIAAGSSNMTKEALGAIGSKDGGADAKAISMASKHIVSADEQYLNVPRQRRLHFENNSQSSYNESRRGSDCETPATSECASSIRREKGEFDQDIPGQTTKVVLHTDSGCNGWIRVAKDRIRRRWARLRRRDTFLE